MLPDAALESLYSKRGVGILGRYAFQEPPKPEHLPALRCLNNVLVRSVASRKLVSNEIGAHKIVATLKVLFFSCVDMVSRLLTATAQ